MQVKIFSDKPNKTVFVVSFSPKAKNEDLAPKPVLTFPENDKNSVLCVVFLKAVDKVVRLTTENMLKTKGSCEWAVVAYAG